MRIFISLGLLLFGTHSHAQDFEYQSPWWLPGGNLQTIYTSQFISAANISYERERLELDDGDFIDLDWVRGLPDAPVVVFFHGLEGDSASFYARNLMFAIKQRGWNGVVANFRGCSGEDNRLARAYFAGDSADITRVLQHVATAYPNNIRYAAGVSLGGNALLKWVGEQGEHAKQYISSAAGISAPLDLTIASNTLDSGFNRIVYTAHFLKSLKAKALHKAEKFPGLLDAGAISKATSFREFDTLVTAKLNGFRDAADYWEKSASIKCSRLFAFQRSCLTQKMILFSLRHHCPPLHKSLPASPWNNLKQAVMLPFLRVDFRVMRIGWHNIY
jgi:predicted alpha/beta-fold hydrolase